MIIARRRTQKNLSKDRMHTRRTNRNITEETEAIYAHWGQIRVTWTQEDNKMLLKLIKAITGVGKD